MTKLQRLPKLKIRGNILHIKQALRQRGVEPERLTQRQLMEAGDLIIAKGLVKARAI